MSKIGLQAAWDHVHSQGRSHHDRPDEELASFIQYLRKQSITRGRVFDAGCGRGRNTIFLAQKGYTVIGCDLSSLAVETAGAHLAQAGLSAGLQVADLRNLPYTADLFAAAICVRVLPYHHKAGIIQCLRELWRVLQPGGSVYLNLLDCSDTEYGCGPELAAHTFLDTDSLPVHFSSQQEIDELFMDFILEKVVRQALTPGLNPRVAWQIWARKPG